MKYFILFIIVATLFSFLIDRHKTRKGCQKGIKMFVAILPTMLNLIILSTVLLSIIPEETILQLLGKNSGITGFLISASIGSIALVPGFISFPVGALLLKQGAAPAVIAVFITTLMMVGVITFPLESKYFGWKISLIRNLLSLLAALLIGFLMGRFL